MHGFRPVTAGFTAGFINIGTSVELQALPDEPASGLGFDKTNSLTCQTPYVLVLMSDGSYQKYTAGVPDPVGQVVCRQEKLGHGRDQGRTRMFRWVLRRPIRSSVKARLVCKTLPVRVLRCSNIPSVLMSPLCYIGLYRTNGGAFPACRSPGVDRWSGGPSSSRLSATGRRHCSGEGQKNGLRQGRRRADPRGSRPPTRGGTWPAAPLASTRLLAAENGVRVRLVTSVYRSEPNRARFPMTDHDWRRQRCEDYTECTLLTLLLRKSFFIPPTIKNIVVCDSRLCRLLGTAGSNRKCYHLP